MADDQRAVKVLRWLPSPTVLLGGVACVIVVAIVFAKDISDPDYFWHVTVGKLISTTGRVPSTDPFSFTWGGQAWTPHEWFSEVLMYQVVSAGGPRAALLFFGLVCAATVGVLTWLLHRLGVRPAVIGLVLALTVWVVTPYVTVRPQAISWLMLTLLLVGLSALRPERPLAVLALTPFFALWANLHGLWVVGLGVVGMYLLFTLAGRTPFASRWRWMLAGTALAVLGTALTPAGPEGILYPLRYVDSGDWGLANIQEWQSPDFHDPRHLGLLALILGLMATGGRGAPGWMRALSWVSVAMALLALRNTPVAAILAAPALALGIEHLLRQRAARPARNPNPSVRLGRRLMEISAALLIAVSALAIGLSRTDAVVRDETFPVAATDLLLHVAPDARVVAEYGWGGYLISRLYERGGRVFVDGRNDMYPQSLLEEYSAVRNAEPRWEQIVDFHQADALLFPPSSAIAKVVPFDSGWCEMYRDDIQVLFMRSCPNV